MKKYHSHSRLALGRYFLLAKVAKGLRKALAKFSELCIYWANLIVKNLKSSYFP